MQNRGQFRNNAAEQKKCLRQRRVTSEQPALAAEQLKVRRMKAI
jgi:hypothetical protein